MKRITLFFVFVILIIGITASFAIAAEEAAKATTKLDYFKVIGVVTASVLTLAAIAGVLSQSHAVKGAIDGIARNPGASGKITIAMVIGLAFIESLVIYTLVVVLILLFVDPFKIL